MAVTVLVDKKMFISLSLFFSVFFCLHGVYIEYVGPLGKFVEGVHSVYIS